MDEILSHGRVRQKLRTKSALVESAQKLIEQGASPTVEDAAAAAGISRTTAYRYFRNQAELLAAAHPETVKSSLLPEHAPAAVDERLAWVVKEITRIVAEHEAQYRTMLRLSLEGAPANENLVLRQGRAIGWIEDALSPLRSELSRAELRRLALAIRSAIGIEALVWLVDVGGLSRAEALKTMRWSAKMLLQGALAGR
ncbi:MAG: TetR family transcriptional regulator [Nannocystaceae bacterium]